MKNYDKQKIDYRIPLYLQLKEKLINQIVSGEYLEGEKIPSERAMVNIYQINRMTIKRAINALVEEGYLYKVKNIGTFVVKNDVNNKFIFGKMNSISNSGLSAVFKESGYQVKNKVIGKGIVNGRNYINYKLQLEKNEQAYYIERLRCLNDEAIVLEQTYIPLQFFPDVDKHNFAQTSLYDYMSSKNHIPSTFHDKMSVLPTTKPIIRKFKIPNDELLFVFEFTSFDQNGDIIEYTLSYTRSSRSSCVFNINK